MRVWNACRTRVYHDRVNHDAVLTPIKPLFGYSLKLPRHRGAAAIGARGPMVEIRGLVAAAGRFMPACPPSVDAASAAGADLGKQ
jgi:hypothetical protein